MPKKRISPGFKLFLLISPFMLLVFILSYFPLYGWAYAFFDYRPPLKLSQCDFVGLKWFEMLFRNPTQVKQLLKVMRNTFAMSGLGLLVSGLPIMFAIFLNEIKAPWYKKFVQTFTTLPNFISWVLVYSFAFSLFSNSGMVNNLAINLGLIDTPIKFLESDNHTWLKMCLWGVWKGLGWSAIMYLAAITGIDQELYEAARVDGAGRFRLMWHITLPGLLPTFSVLILLSVANFLSNGLDQYYVFQNAFNREHIQVLDLYVYNISVGGQNSYSPATALSILKSIISVTLLFVVNRLSKVTRGETIV
jgi:multiple sugar transport system permease protein/putative aldouronate transport system permease protein